ncbi:MAG: hypothetical protein LBE78_12425 [Burkholderiaceae bacterium]|jgi:hypothetical protein|nr:hypothetical protein [Burkholderiaceae bacterium]
MNIDFGSFDYSHLLGQSATHPIRSPSGALAALLVLAGRGIAGRLCPFALSKGAA